MNELIIALIPLLIQVESSGKTDAIGDNGQAVGCLQIHKILVDDVNRILGEKVFYYRDRKNQALSCRMLSVYLTHYGKAYEKQTGKKATMEVLSRIWNGGPSGWTKKDTMAYWKKVEKEYKARQKAQE